MRHGPRKWLRSPVGPDNPSDGRTTDGGAAPVRCHKGLGEASGHRSARLACVPILHGRGPPVDRLTCRLTAQNPKTPSVGRSMTFERHGYDPPHGRGGRERRRARVRPEDPGRFTSGRRGVWSVERTRQSECPSSVPDGPTPVESRDPRYGQLVHITVSSSGEARLSSVQTVAVRATPPRSPRVVRAGPTPRPGA